MFRIFKRHVEEQVNIIMCPHCSAEYIVYAVIQCPVDCEDRHGGFDTGCSQHSGTLFNIIATNFCPSCGTKYPKIENKPRQGWTKEELHNMRTTK